MATYIKRKDRWAVVVRKKGFGAVSKTFRTKSIAERWAQSVEDQMEAGTYGLVPEPEPVVEEVLFSAVLMKYQTEITPRKGAKKAELSRLRSILRHMGDKSVDKLTPQDVVAYVDARMSEDRVGSDTVRRELSTISHVFRTANALWGYKLINPVGDAREVLSATRTLQPGEKRDRRLAPEEEEALLNAASPALRLVIKFALETGMRRGEITALTWEDVRGDTVWVPNVEGARKTGEGRLVPLSIEAKQILAARKLLKGREKTVFGVQRDGVTIGFTRAAQRAGLKNLRFHDLRHEATSRFFEKRLGIQEVAVITGHSDWKSLKRYTHLSVVDIAKRLQRIL